MGVTNAFYGYVETAYSRQIISGYTCGSGCLEFRPGNGVTRAQLTKIVVLPIVSLTYVESAAEFRRAEWSVPPPLEPLPVLASSEEAKAGPGPVIREASGVHARPLEPLPSPSGVHRVPPMPAS